MLYQRYWTKLYKWNFVVVSNTILSIDSIYSLTNEDDLEHTLFKKVSNGPAFFVTIANSTD